MQVLGSIYEEMKGEKEEKERREEGRERNKEGGEGGGREFVLSLHAQAAPGCCCRLWHSQ